MIVHICLEDRAKRDPEYKQQVRTTIEEIVGMTDIDEGQFQRFSILSGEVTEENIRHLTGIAGVKSVLIDNKKYTSKLSA